MTPAVLADLVHSFADDVLTRRGLDPAALPVTVAVQRPRDPQHGDYVTNVALQTARKVGVDPQEFAGWLADALAASPAVRSAEVAGPGFLNLRLTAGARAATIRQILAAPNPPSTEPPSTEPPSTEPPSTEPPSAGSPPGPELNTTAVGAVPDSTGVELGASGVVYAVQYAHARLAALARNAADLGIAYHGAALELLEHEREVALISALGEFPRIAALDRPHRLLGYLADLAERHHDLVDICRMLPMGDEEPGPLHAARLTLCEATRRVLADGLRRLGASAPERM